MSLAIYYLNPSSSSWPDPATTSGENIVPSPDAASRINKSSSPAITTARRLYDLEAINQAPNPSYLRTKKGNFALISAKKTTNFTRLEPAARIKISNLDIFFNLHSESIREVAEGQGLSSELWDILSTPNPLASGVQGRLMGMQK